MLKGRGLTAEELKNELKAFQSEVRKDVEAALAKQLQEIRDLRPAGGRGYARNQARTKTQGSRDASPLVTVQEANDQNDREPLLLSSESRPDGFEPLGVLPSLTLGEEDDDIDSLHFGKNKGNKDPKTYHRSFSGAKNFVRELADRGEDEEKTAVKKEQDIVPKNIVQKVLLPIVTSNAWSCFSAFLVITQCVTLCVNVDCQMKVEMHKQFQGRDVEPVPAICAHVEQVLDANLIMFTFEMVAKLVAEQFDFFCGPAWSWNLFDVSLWAIVFLDHFHLLPGSVGLLRIVRMIRLLRLFEVFHELRTMLYSIYACATSLAWGFILLSVFIVMTAVYLEDVALLYVKHDWVGDDDKAALRDNWNGMFHASLSLVFGITGGQDWGDLAGPFFAMESNIPHFHGLVFTFFVVVTCIGMLNILVGIFCEKTQDLSDVSREVALTNAYRRVKQNAEHVHELFDEFEKANPDFITREEIIKGLKDKRIQTHFHHLGIDVLKPSLLVKLFDGNASGTVERGEFVKGCQRLQGGAKPAEMAEILTHVKLIVQSLDIDGPQRDRTSISLSSES